MAEVLALPLWSCCSGSVGRGHSISSWRAAGSPRLACWDAALTLWHSRAAHSGCCLGAGHPGTAAPQRPSSAGWSPWAQPEQRTEQRSWLLAWWRGPLGYPRHRDHRLTHCMETQYDVLQWHLFICHCYRLFLPRKKQTDSDRLHRSRLGAIFPRTRPICSSLFSPGLRASLCKDACITLLEICIS